MVDVPLFDARCATRFALKQFGRILERATDVNIRGPRGRTALFLAARSDRLGHISLLLQKGADPNLADESDEAPLQVASRHGHLECVNQLLRAGVNIDRCPDPSKTGYSETALCSAISHRFDIVAERLLECGANPNAISSARKYALHAAA